MGVNHDSHIRSDWLPIHVTRTVAKRFAEDLIAASAAEGVHLNGAHSGRRGGNPDSIGATTPLDWKGKSTVKVRGCDGYRNGVYVIARRLAAEQGIRWGNEAFTLGNPDAEMTPNEIDYAIINAKLQGKIVRIYTGGPDYVRGYPGDSERVEDWDTMKSTVVIPVGARKVPLLDITKVEVE